MSSCSGQYELVLRIAELEEAGDELSFRAIELEEAGDEPRFGVLEIKTRSTRFDSKSSGSRTLLFTSRTRKTSSFFAPAGNHSSPRVPLSHPA